MPGTKGFRKFCSVSNSTTADSCGMKHERKHMSMVLRCSACATLLSSAARPACFSAAQGLAMYATDIAVGNTANLGSTLLALSDAYRATAGIAMYSVCMFCFVHFSITSSSLLLLPQSEAALDHQLPRLIQAAAYSSPSCAIRGWKPSLLMTGIAADGGTRLPVLDMQAIAKYVYAVLNGKLSPSSAAAGPPPPLAAFGRRKLQQVSPELCKKP